MKNRAFTLIELLVVVLIIGILAAIAVPQYQKAVIKSRFSTLKAMTKALVQAEEEYFLVHSTYTSKIKDLSISTGGQEGGTNAIFPWGWCQVYYNVSDGYANCGDNDIKMYYQIYFSTINRPTLCITWDGKTDSPQYDVCQQETGHSHAYKDGALYVFKY